MVSTANLHLYNKAEAFNVKEGEDLTDELDESLRRHRPRAGRLEEENRRDRSLQLMEQSRRFNRFLRGAVRSAGRCKLTLA